MSQHYLLDGYNIVHQMPLLNHGKLEDERQACLSGRQALVQFIEQTRPQGSARNSVTIVFDGHGGWSAQRAFSQIKIVFSQDKSADDKIKQLVEDSSSKKTIVVVTDDRAIQYAVRALGAHVCPVKEFLSKGRTGLKKISKQTSLKNIPKTVEDRITSEFEKVWIKGLPGRQAGKD